MDNISTDFDYLLVGGGLQNGLIALALRHFQPQATVCLVERGRHLGGNHTWCFHADDVEGEAEAVVSPLVVSRWPGYRVWFPRRQRDLDAPYHMVTSARFDRVVTDALAASPGCEVLTGATAVHLAANGVTLADGRTLSAGAVIDARGPERTAIDDTRCGYQKFVGLEVRTARPHGLDRPILMDARVAQIDGFRFVYVLPLADDVLLIEDTRFSDGPELDAVALRLGVEQYAQEAGFEVAQVLRVERGVLPWPWAGDVLVPDDDEPLVAGFQGGWFHPVTGYSFPVALRFALHVAGTPMAELRGSGLARLVRAQRRQLGLAHGLNKMLFKWFAPHDRIHVLERFYGLPEPLIRRFYAMRSTEIDRARIFIGRPPRGMSYRAALLGRSIK